MTGLPQRQPNLVILTRQRPDRAPFLSWLGDAIRTAHLFTDDGRVKDFAAMGFRHIHGFSDYESNAQVELEVLQLGREWRIDRIIATAEFDILRAGRLRSHFGLAGQSGASAYAFRDKVAMKRHLTGRTTTVDVPPFARIHDSYDLIRFIDDHGYPAVVKPVAGSGSAGTVVLSEEKDLRAILRRPLAGDLEVERFIPGPMYHVDGLVADGRIVFSWPSLYAYGCLAYRDGQMTSSHMLAPGNPLQERLRVAAEEVLSLLPTPTDTTFHLELFHTPDNRLCFCEIASRTGGSYINALLEDAFGFNPNQLFVRLQAGLPVDLDPVRDARPARLLAGGISTVQHGIFEGPASEAPDLPFVRRFDWMLRSGDVCHGAHESVEGVATFIVEFDREEDAADRLRQVDNWTARHARWRQLPAG